MSVSFWSNYENLKASIIYIQYLKNHQSTVHVSTSFKNIKSTSKYIYSDQTRLIDISAEKEFFEHFE